MANFLPFPDESDSTLREHADVFSEGLRASHDLGKAAIGANLMTEMLTDRKRELLAEQTQLYRNVQKYAEGNQEVPRLPGLSDAGGRFLAREEGRLLAQRWTDTFRRTFLALDEIEQEDATESASTEEWARLVRALSSGISVLVNKANQN